MLKKILLRCRVYILSCFVIIVSFVAKAALIGYMPLNAYDTFLQYMVEESPYTFVCFIIAAILPAIWQENTIQTKGEYKKTDRQMLWLATKAGFAFVIPYICAFMLCLLIGKSDRPFTGLGYGISGILGSLRFQLPLAYIILYLVNSFVFAFSFNYLAQSIVIVFKDRTVALIMCIIINYIYLFIPVSPESVFFNRLLFVLPYYSFAFLGNNVSILNRLMEFGSIIVFSYAMQHLKITGVMLHRKAVNNKEDIISKGE